MNTNYKEVTTVVTQPPWSLILHLIPIVTVAILAVNGAPKVAICPLSTLFSLNCLLFAASVLCPYDVCTLSIQTGGALSGGTLQTVLVPTLVHVTTFLQKWQLDHTKISLHVQFYASLVLNLCILQSSTSFATTESNQSLFCGAPTFR
jgi:hypothetical protein